MIKNFIKNKFKNIKTREKYAFVACIININFNIILFISKVVIGFSSNSIAIITDGVDNLIDSVLSGIILLGFKFANKPADEKHPFGYGRFEYILTFLVSNLILLFGVFLMKSSLIQILNPKSIKYSKSVLALLLISILVKIFLAKFNKVVGEKIKSPLMKLNSIDCITDIISTSAAAISLIIYKCISFNIDGVIGVIQSISIIYIGFRSAKDSTNLLLGSNVDSEVMDRMKKIICSYKDINGIHNLVIHDYGSGKMWGSVHLEFDSNNSRWKIDKLVGDIQYKFREDLDQNMNIHVDLICKK